jgi:hypothetical protein
MGFYHQRIEFLCFLFMVLGVVAHAQQPPMLPPPTYPGPSPIIDDNGPVLTTDSSLFRGMLLLQPPHQGGAITSGTVNIIVTTEGRVFGNVWNGEESQRFDGFVDSRGAFHVRLDGGGRIRGKIGDDGASGKIFHRRRPTRWIAARIFVSETVYGLNTPWPPYGPLPPNQIGQGTYEGRSPLIPDQR